MCLLPSLKSRLLKIFGALLVCSFVSGCAGNILAGLGLETDTPRFWNMYNKVKADADTKAMAGEISWVEASIRVRDADKFLAENKAGYDTSWKFDANDIEYHAYVIAIAERLDRGEITFAAFDALRIAKLNEIQRSTEALQLQRSLVDKDISQSSTGRLMCMRSGEFASQGMGTHCVYDCLSGQVIQTIRSGICPISITR